MAPNGSQYISLSTVCVGVGPGGTTSMLARCTLVNREAVTLLDVFVAPTENMQVTDYRTAVTGITAAHLSGPTAQPFPRVQQRVAEMIRNKIVVGYSLWIDLSVLGIPHPAVLTRDVALYIPFRNTLRTTNIVGLQRLMWDLMRRRVGDKENNSLETARAAMDLFRSAEGQWEAAISNQQWPCALPPGIYSRCYL